MTAHFACEFLAEFIVTRLGDAGPAAAAYVPLWGLSDEDSAIAIALLDQRVAGDGRRPSLAVREVNAMTKAPFGGRQAFPRSAWLRNSLRVGGLPGHSTTSL